MIILYGPFGDRDRDKQQKTIDGELGCSYREYAEYCGSMVYLCQQKVSKPWEHSICKANDIIEYCRSKPNEIVLSVKHDIPKDKVLREIHNPKLYYSCSSHNIINSNCDISLVDTGERLIDTSCRLFDRGKNEQIWKPTGQPKDYDYVLVGRAGDKGQMKFLSKLKAFRTPRKVIWIGGAKYKKKSAQLAGRKHTIKCTNMSNHATVSKLMTLGKVGILFTEFEGESFPQTFMELTMCGVPVVYNKDGPYNKRYFHKHNAMLTDEDMLLKTAENLLRNCDSEACRKEAVENYTTKSSYESLKRLVNGKSGNYR